jgi:hypothetical protein
MPRSVGFEVLLIRHTNADWSTADAFLRENGIKNAAIVQIPHSDDLKPEDFKGKRVLSIYTSSMTSHELAITPHELIKQKCEQVNALFLLYVFPQQSTYWANQKFEGCLYGQDGAFRKWAGATPDPITDNVTITTLFSKFVRPFCILAAVAIIAGIFSYRLGYLQALSKAVP